MLFAWLLSVALGYDGYNKTLTEAYTRYSEEYQIDLRMATASMKRFRPRRRNT